MLSHHPTVCSITFVRPPIWKFMESERGLFLPSLPYWLNKWLPSALWFLISVKLLNPHEARVELVGGVNPRVFEWRCSRIPQTHTLTRSVSLSFHASRTLSPRLSLAVSVCPLAKVGWWAQRECGGSSYIKSSCMFRSRSPSPWPKEMRTFLSEGTLF